MRIMAGISFTYKLHNTVLENNNLPKNKTIIKNN